MSDPRQPAYDAVFRVIRKHSTDVHANAFAWRCVEAALSAMEPYWGTQAPEEPDRPVEDHSGGSTEAVSRTGPPEWCNLPAGHDGDHDPTRGASQMCGPMYFGQSTETAFSAALFAGLGTSVEDITAPDPNRLGGISITSLEGICICTWGYWDPNCPDPRHTQTSTTGDTP